MSLERCLERRFCDAASVVRNRGRGNDSDDFERKVFADTGRDKSIDILIVETAALFDQCFCQSRQGGELAVLRQATLTNGLNVLWFEPFLERQNCVERDRPGACVGHRIGKQQDLDLCFRETAAVDSLEQADEAVDQDREMSTWHRQCSGAYRRLTATVAVPVLNVQVRRRSY